MGLDNLYIGDEGFRGLEEIVGRPPPNKHHDEDAGTIVTFGIDALWELIEGVG